MTGWATMPIFSPPNQPNALWLCSVSTALRARASSRGKARSASRESESG